MKSVTIRKVEKGIVDSDKKQSFKRIQLSIDEATDFSLNKICLSVVEEGKRPIDRSKVIRSLIRYADDLSLLDLKSLLEKFAD